ncbi:putative T7SS-secreted protein [Streptomyces sp. NPDC008139]|uniref:WXG100 family type VII secretion target n=1 Tax=Streptomyces sp. NPDC008139 TaxID=3364814 RepID=UPI0036E5CA0B
MTRPTDWHNLDLDSDPTPGDVYEIRAEGRRFQTFAEDVATVHSLLNSAAKDQALAEWNGKAAEAFRGQIGKLPGQLGKLHDSYGAAGDALVTFADSVETEQSAADGALSQARLLRNDLAAKQTELARAQVDATTAGDAKAKLDGSKGSAGGAGGNVPPPDPDKVRQAVRNAQQADAHKDQVAGQVSGIQQQLAELRKKAQDAGTNHGTAVDVLKKDLDHASDVGIHNKKWYQKLGDFLVKAWSVILPILKVIVAIGGILLLFIGGPLAWIVLAAALLVFADTLVKFIQGKAGWGDLLFAALDCIPVMGKVSMLVKAGEIGKLKWAVKILQAERKYQNVIKVWKYGEDLSGFRKVAFGFAKGLGKDTLKDAMNGGWTNVKKNFLANVAGNTIGAGLSPLVDKGFAKIPRLYYNGPISAMSGAERRALGHLSMDMNGLTQRGKTLIGATKGLVTSVTKETVKSTVFGKDFTIENIGFGTLTGFGNSGGGYHTGRH